jgi:hypothetical protein
MDGGTKYNSGPGYDEPDNLIYPRLSESERGRNDNVVEFAAINQGELAAMIVDAYNRAVSAI